jgi:inosose dehydratase
MKIAYTVWTWMNDEFGRETPTDHAEKNFEEALRSISYLGYQCVENFNFIVPLYENRPEDLKKLLEKYNLQLVNLYHTYYEDDLDKWLDLGERTCKLLQYCGAKHLNVQGNIWHDEPYYRPTDYDALDMYIDAFSKMGAISRKYGIQTCLHPHGATRMLTEEQIDYFIKNVDTDLVKLTLDTDHTVLGGMDPVYAFDKYGDLISYVHFKDIDPDPNNYVIRPNERFRSLGQGFVDFRNVVKVLEKHGYDGVLCVENDRPLICNFESAQYSRYYLRAVLGF